MSRKWTAGFYTRSNHYHKDLRGSRILDIEGAKTFRSSFSSAKKEKVRISIGKNSRELGHDEHEEGKARRVAVRVVSDVSRKFRGQGGLDSGGL